MHRNRHAGGSPAEPAAAEKKAAPAPDTAQPQPIIRPIDDDFKTLLANTIEDAADDSGWAFLGIVGGVLTKKMPDFDPPITGTKTVAAGKIPFENSRNRRAPVGK